MMSDTNRPMAAINPVTVPLSSYASGIMVEVIIAMIHPPAKAAIPAIR